MKYTWGTMAASSFWDMHLSVACTTTDAEFQNRIIIRNRTLKLDVVARQPHPDPNQTPHTAPHPRSRSAEPKGLNRPGTSSGSQITGRLGARELTGGWHLDLSMLSDPSIC